MFPIGLGKHNHIVVTVLEWAFIAMALLLVFSAAYAQGPAVPPPPTQTVTAQTMLLNIGRQVPSLMRMITAFGYVIGLYFIIRGVVLLKHAGYGVASTCESVESFESPY